MRAWMSRGRGGVPTGVSDPLIIAATNEVIQAITRIMDPIELVGQNGGGLSSSFKRKPDWHGACRPHRSVAPGRAGSAGAQVERRGWGLEAGDGSLGRERPRGDNFMQFGVASR